MTATFYICMTSGMRGPELELTTEQVNLIVKLAEGLTQPWDGSKLAGHGLGPDHYSVYWQDGEDHCSVMTESSGFVRLWKKGDTDWTQYKDTVGLWSHLSQYASPANQKRLEDMKKEVEAYESTIFKIPGP